MTPTPQKKKAPAPELVQGLGGLPSGAKPQRVMKALMRLADGEPFERATFHLTIKEKRYLLDGAFKAKEEFLRQRKVKLAIRAKAKVAAWKKEHGEPLSPEEESALATVAAEPPEPAPLDLIPLSGAVDP